jgi:transposase
VDGILSEVFGEKRASAILSVATYMVCRGNVIEYISDWCGEYTLDPIIDVKRASTLFSTITFDDKMKFFRAWVSQNLTSSGYLAYDVTSISCYGKEVLDAEWGYNRDGEKLPQINMGCYIQQQSGLPIFYVTYPGSIIDKSHMPYIMEYNKDLDINNVIFVMDRGFCSTRNLQWLHSNNMQYVMGVDKFHKATGAAIDQVKDNIISLRNRVKEGVYSETIHSRFYGITSYMHIFYNNELSEIQRTNLFRRVEDNTDKLRQLQTITPKEAKKFSRFHDINIYGNNFSYELNFDKIDVEAGHCGFFCILSNIDKPKGEILEIYNRKDEIEKGFDDLKNYLDMKRVRVHSDAAIGGKLFCAFIALIAASQISEKLRSFNEAGGHRRISKGKLISELEKIKVILRRGGNRRLANPVTKKQRELLSAIGIPETNLKSFVSPKDG